jgi:hypothetical protein
VECISAENALVLVLFVRNYHWLHNSKAKLPNFNDAVWDEFSEQHHH